MKYAGFLLLILLVLPGCYQGECFRCRKFAPDPSGEGTYFTGTQKICPENDNIYLLDPEPGDSTDLWECEPE